MKLKDGIIYLLFISLMASNCTAQNSSDAKYNTEVAKIGDYIKGKAYDKYEVATFAGGCFWCTEAAFERIEGVVDVISGYSGGKKAYPTYREVANKQTKHAEAIQIYYDPAKVNFNTLLEVFFVAHDPTQLDRQGPDVGPQYRSEVFYHNEQQQKDTQAFIQKVGDSGIFKDPIVTKVSAYKEFWVAEGYHQDFYERNPYQGYVVAVSKPKVKKVEKTYAYLLKEQYK